MEIIERYSTEFGRFYDLLTEYNAKFNLTAITEKNEVYVKHFEDSLAGLKYISGGVLDVGAGAGFPCVPLAIVMRDSFPTVKFTAADSLKKRVDFLNTVIEELSLKNIRAVHIRAEDLNKNEKYDTVAARAVAPLNILCEYCLPFVKRGGVFVAYKGKSYLDEVEGAQKAIKILGGRVKNIELYKLNTPDNGVAERALVIIEKVRECDGKYPRGGNKPRIEQL
jgi:16S rRNA (guanine527-N7)-methyltransferase